MTKATNHLAREIRARRQAIGLTMKKLSELAGLGESYISEIERGLIEYPRVSTLRSVARALGCGISDLTGEPETLSDETLDYPKLQLAFAVAAKKLLNQELTERDIALLEMGADIYDWLAREERQGRPPEGVDDILRRIVLVRGGRR